MSAISSSSASIAPRPMTAADKTAFRLPASLGALAARFGGEIAGDGAAAVRVRAVAALHCAGAGDLTFFDDSRFDGALARTRAAAVLLPPAHATATALPRWICDEPRAALVELLEAAYAPAPAKPGVAAGARIADGARVHESASIGANAVVEEDAEIAAAAVLQSGAVVGRGARIGARTVVGANAVVCAGVVVGVDCVLHGGAVVGGDGFGYYRGGAVARKIPQIGRVIVGDRVEIGANTAIDRGALGDTTIGDDAKIDNLVQIGHNVEIGAGAVICGCVGIAGSAVVGKGATIAGAASIGGHVRIGDFAVIGATSAVTADVPPGAVFASVWPAMPARVWRRLVARLRRLALAAESKSNHPAKK